MFFFYIYTKNTTGKKSMPKLNEIYMITNEGHTGANLVYLVKH